MVAETLSILGILVRRRSSLRCWKRVIPSYSPIPIYRDIPSQYSEMRLPTIRQGSGRRHPNYFREQLAIDRDANEYAQDSAKVTTFAALLQVPNSSRDDSVWTAAEGHCPAETGPWSKQPIMIGK